MWGMHTSRVALGREETADIGARVSSRPPCRAEGLNGVFSETSPIPCMPASVLGVI